MKEICVYKFLGWISAPIRIRMNGEKRENDGGFIWALGKECSEGEKQQNKFIDASRKSVLPLVLRQRQGILTILTDASIDIYCTTRFI